MTRASDHRWTDALLAEVSAIDSRWERLLWLAGAPALLLSHYGRRLVLALSPVSIALFVATAVCCVMAVTEYEGFLAEDDWYSPITAALGAALVFALALNLRRQAHPTRP